MSNPATVALTASAALGMLQPVAQAIETSAHVTPETATAVNQTMGVLTAATQELGTSDTMTDAKPILEEIVAAGQTVVGVALRMPLPSTVTLWLGIAQSLLTGLSAIVPMIEAHHSAPVVAVAPAT